MNSNRLSNKTLKFKAFDSQNFDKTVNVKCHGYPLQPTDMENPEEMPTLGKNQKKKFLVEFKKYGDKD